MDFSNTFTVRVPLDQVWTFMLDAEKVTPCVAGAAITEVVDDTHFKGTVKVKLGAVQMTYRGELQMEPDVVTHTVKLRARGTDVRGGGGASGTVVTRLTEHEGATTVAMESHVDVTGRVAQFGRGIMQDVANRLVKEFASCLETRLAEESNERAEPTDPHPPATPVEGLTQPDERAGSTSNVPTGPMAPTTPRPSVRDADAEIRPVELLASVARSRLASLLRSLAAKIDPN